MNNNSCTINIYHDSEYHDSGYNNYLEYSEDDWGFFVDIDIYEYKQNTKYLNNQHIIIHDYDFKKKTKKPLSKILIGLTSTTIITIGVSYLILYVL
jgi:hypothetical protein